MSQNTIAGIPLISEDGHHAIKARKKQQTRPLREGMVCGLDVEPEVAFREGQTTKTKN